MPRSANRYGGDQSEPRREDATEIRHAENQRRREADPGEHAEVDRVDHPPDLPALERVRAAVRAREPDEHRERCEHQHERAKHSPSQIVAAGCRQPVVQRCSSRAAPIPKAQGCARCQRAQRPRRRREVPVGRDQARRCRSRAPPRQGSSTTTLAARPCAGTACIQNAPPARAPRRSTRARPAMPEPAMSRIKRNAPPTPPLGEAPTTTRGRYSANSVVEKRSSPRAMLDVSALGLSRRELLPASRSRSCSRRRVTDRRAATRRSPTAGASGLRCARRDRTRPDDREVVGPSSTRLRAGLTGKPVAMPSRSSSASTTRNERHQGRDQDPVERREPSSPVGQRRHDTPPGQCPMRASPAARFLHGPPV